jgi:hypothetical protein
VRTTTALLIALVACSKHEPPPPPPTAGSAAATAAKPAAGSAAVAIAAHAGSGSGSGTLAVQPLTAEQRTARASYRAAMARGRKATDAKAYADAITAFDDALKARPNEPHALAERGFAKLLAGTDLDAASADFDHAADATRDPKLLGMIWFNRGLADDKLGHADAALVDYYLANKSFPNKTAAGKVVGKKVCPLRVAPPAEISADPPVDAADWLALDKALDVDTPEPPKTSAEARAAIFGSADKVALPAAVVVGSYASKAALVVADRAGKLRAVSVAHAMGGRCSGSVGAEVVSVQGTLVHVRATEQVGGGTTELCHSGSGDGVVAECTGAEGEEPQGTACDDTGTTVRDVVIDLATGTRLLVAEQAAPATSDASAVALDDARLVKATLAADGLHLSGLGCDQVLPVAAK